MASMEYWIFMAFVAPVLWALVAIIDSYSLHGIYEDEYDGMVVSGVFQSLPWILVPFGIITFTLPEVEVSMLAFAAGGLFILAFFYYFKALFVSNDSALMHVLWNLSVPLVPFFAWLMMGEVLTIFHYIGIGIAFFGISLFTLDGKISRIGFFRIVSPMFFAAVFLSLSMVVAKKAYELSVVDFWSIFLIFSLGATITSLLTLAAGKQKVLEKAKKIVLMSRKYFFLFLLAEGLSLAGTITSQMAINLSPSVSFVAVIESLVPVFVMLFSLFLIQILKIFDKPLIGELYKQQLSGAWIKIFALMFVIFGIYIVV